MTVSELVQQLVKAMNGGEVDPNALVLTPDCLETQLVIAGPHEVYITDEE